jgi:hypothetical protein
MSRTERSSSTPARRYFFRATSTTLRIKAVNEIDAVTMAQIRMAEFVSIKITSLWRQACSQRAAPPIIA